MAPVVIHGGATVDLLNAAELGAELDLRLGADQRKHWWAEVAAEQQAKEREQYRAIKYIRRDAQLSTPATTRLTITDSILAESGQAWIVRLLSAQLASAGTFQAFITSDTDTTRTAASQRRLVANGASGQFQTFTYNTGACVLLPDEGLFLSAAQNILSYYVAGWQLPAETIARLA